MNRKIKLALADDETLFRDGLSELLKQYPEIKLINEATNGKDLLDQVKAKQPDVVLLDLEMPEMDGFKTAVELNKRHPAIKIIVLSSHDKKRFIIEAIRSGACAYLFKNTIISEVRTAINEVMEKGFYLNSYISEAMFKGWSSKRRIKPDPNGRTRLTKRELEILKHLCKQLSSPEIAAIMNISPRTVDNYRFRLLEKTKSENVAGLAFYAIENGLVKLDLRKKSIW